MSSSSPTFTRYIIQLTKIPGAETKSEVVARHIEHLRFLDQTGKLVLCGPVLDHPEGLVVVKAADKNEAVSIAQADPFVKEGVRTYTVKTWLLACAENDYLR